MGSRRRHADQLAFLTGHRPTLAELDTPGWRPDLEGTLLFVVRGDEVLLIRKHRGHGAGRINAPGGKREVGESAIECALRETREEVGIEVSHADHRAEFRFIDIVDDDWLGHVFVAHTYSGVPVETAEATPMWCPIAGLPFDRMWPDDRYWLPRVLAGERLTGSFLFENARLIEHRIRPWQDS